MFFTGTTLKERLKLNSALSFFYIGVLLLSNCNGSYQLFCLVSAFKSFSHVDLNEYTALSVTVSFLVHFTSCITVHKSVRVKKSDKGLLYSVSFWLSTNITHIAH